MGRAPCCDKEGVKRGAWSPEEDALLVQYIKEHGHGSWRNLPKLAGLQRCGKSCRLRWSNYLRPDIKRGPFTAEEEASIIQLHDMLGNKWAAIASKLPGRTDNEIKNFWNTHLKKRLLSMGHNLHINRSPSSSELNNMKCESPSTRHMVQWESARVEAEARLSLESSLFCSSSTEKTDCDVFISLWNSEVGESFRKITWKDGQECRTPTSQTSSSTKLGPDSVVGVQATPSRTLTSTDTTREQKDGCRPNLDAVAGSDSISSNEFTDSSDTALKQLLDFPGSHDMEFLQEQTDHFSSFLDLRYE